MEKNDKKKIRPKQQQNRPGLEKKMKPVPDSEPKKEKKGKLYNKVAIITGGDSGIGKATALLFAMEGAKISIAYLNETSDAQITKEEIEALGSACILIKGDLSKENNCKKVVEKP